MTCTEEAGDIAEEIRDAAANVEDEQTRARLENEAHRLRLLQKDLKSYQP